MSRMDDGKVDGKYVAQFYPHVVLAATLIMMGLPWVSGLAAYQVTGTYATIGCMLFIIGALFVFKTRFWGAFLQSVALLLFYASDFALAGGYWAAVAMVIVTWVFALSPRTFDRFTRSIAGEK